MTGGSPLDCNVVDGVGWVVAGVDSVVVVGVDTVVSGSFEADVVVTSDVPAQPATTSAATNPANLILLLIG